MVTFGYRFEEVRFSPLHAESGSLSIPIEKPVSVAISIQPGDSCPTPRRIMAWQLLDIPGYVPVVPDISDKANQVIGLQQRLGRDIPVPDGPLLDEFFCFVDAHLETLVPLEKVLTFEEWLATTSYNEHRKQQLRDIAARIQDPSELPGHLRRKIASFIKSESYGMFKFPRWINSRSDWFKVICGPMFKSIEHEIYESRWYIKHVAIPDRRQKIQELRGAGRQYFQTDYKAFESHFTPAFMEGCECKLYRHMMSVVDPKLANIVALTLSSHNHGRTRAGVSFKLDGRRMSGDMCTSLGNGFTNEMLWRFMASKMGFETLGHVEGDDGIFATWGCHVDAIDVAKLAEKLGFTIDIVEYDDPGKASFCGILCADDAIIKDPRSVLESFGWSYSFIGASDKVRRELLRAKAMSLAYELPQCPILGALARRVLDDTVGSKARFINDGYHDTPVAVPLDPFLPSVSTRSLFAQLFDVPVSAQLVLEHALARLPLSESLALLSDSIPPRESHAVMRSLYVFST